MREKLMINFNSCVRLPLSSTSLYKTSAARKFCSVIGSNTSQSAKYLSFVLWKHLSSITHQSYFYNVLHFNTCCLDQNGKIGPDYDCVHLFMAGKCSGRTGYVIYLLNLYSWFISQVIRPAIKYILKELVQVNHDWPPVNCRIFRMNQIPSLAEWRIIFI